MTSKPFLKLLLLTAVLLGVQMGLLTPESALAAPCCQTCDANYVSCMSNCEYMCGGDQSCLSVCYEGCEGPYWQCYRHCIRCSGGGGGPACCYDFSGYCPAECSSCIDC